MNFSEFRTFYSLYLRGGSLLERTGMSPSQAYIEAAPFFKTHTIWEEMLAEATLYASGQPVFKVYPAMVNALLATNIDIEMKHFRLPFMGIELRLPVGFVRENASSPFLRSIILGECFDDVGNRGIRFMMDFDCPGNIPLVAGIIIRVYEDRSILESFSSLLTSNHVREGYWPSEEFFTSLIKLAVGVVFLAIGAHKTVCEDKPNVAERLREEKLVKRNGENARPKLRFSVGKDIKLPREIHDETRDSSLTGRELKYGHIRCGHLRRQPTGSRTAPVYKIIFIPPTVVRADLPLKPHAYAVKV